MLSWRTACIDGAKVKARPGQCMSTAGYPSQLRSAWLTMAADRSCGRIPVGKISNLHHACMNVWRFPLAVRRYGHKTEATDLLKEWVRDVGVHAGAHAFNTRISSGFVGAPESRLEVRLCVHALVSGGWARAFTCA